MRRSVPLALVGAALVAYLAFACPWVLGGDEGEFAALFARGGVAHPPGYPLWTLVMRAMRWMPGASPALASARVTAVVGAAGVGVLYVACRSWRASRGASAVACVLYAFAPLTWIYATQAEVFALNAVLCSALLAVAGPACSLRAGRRLVATGVVVGLGLAHHPTFLAMAPVAMLAVARAWREQAAEGRLRSSVLAACATVLGLAPYAVLVWASRHPEGRWVWGPPMDLQGLVHHVLRVDYWRLRAEDARAPVPRAHLAMLWHSLGDATLWGGLALAVPGAVRGLARDRAGTIALAWTWLLAGPGVLATLVGRPVGIYAVIIERMHILPALLLSLPIAWGVDLLLDRTPPRARDWIALGAAVALEAIDVWRVPPRIAEIERPTVQHYLEDTLASVPSGAVLVGVGDHRFFGFLVEQRILGLRPDVVYVDAGMLRAGWYRARVATALGRGGPVGSDARELVGSLVAAGRQVFLTDSVEGLAPAGCGTLAIGTVVRVLPRGSSPPRPEDLERANLALARAFHRDPTPPRDPWSWAGEADATYARPWIDLARAYEAIGDRAAASRCLERAGAR